MGEKNNNVEVSTQIKFPGAHFLTIQQMDSKSLYAFY